MMIAEQETPLAAKTLSDEHFYGLDILRVISVLAVVFFHFAFRGEAAGELPAINISDAVKNIAKDGSLGVSVFFIISGFVIAYSAEGQKPLNFLVSRFSRIYPTFFIIMSLTATVILLSSNPLFTISAKQYVANIFIFSKLTGEPFVDGAYWSIVLEVIFYGWIFIIITLGQFRNILRIIPFWLALSCLNELYIGSEHLQNLFITEYSGFFAMGIILNRLRNGFSLYATVLFVVAAIYSIHTSNAGIAWAEQAYSTEFSPIIRASVIFVAIAVFILLLRLKVGVRYRHGLSMLGGMTYALYLLHQNIGYIVITGLMHSVSASTAIATTVTGLIVFSGLYHVMVERRLNPKLKRQLLRLVNKPNRPVATAL